MSETIFTEGLGSVIGLKRARKQSLEEYITVILLWLLQGGTDFTQDRYLQELVNDSQSIIGIISYRPGQTWYVGYRP